MTNITDCCHKGVLAPSENHYIFNLVSFYEVELWTPVKRKSIGVLLDTKSPINNPRKRSICYRKVRREQRGVRHSQLNQRYHSLLQRAANTVLFCRVRITLYKLSFSTPRRNKNMAKWWIFLLWGVCGINSHNAAKSATSPLRCKEKLCLKSTVFLCHSQPGESHASHRGAIQSWPCLQHIYTASGNYLWRQHFWISACRNSHLKQLMVTSLAPRCELFTVPASVDLKLALTRLYGAHVQAMKTLPSENEMMLLLQRTELTLITMRFRKLFSLHTTESCLATLGSISSASEKLRTKPEQSWEGFTRRRSLLQSWPWSILNDLPCSLRTAPWRAHACHVFSSLLFCSWECVKENRGCSHEIQMLLMVFAYRGIVSLQFLFLSVDGGHGGHLQSMWKRKPQNTFTKTVCKPNTIMFLPSFHALNPFQGHGVAGASPSDCQVKWGGVPLWTGDRATQSHT